MGKREDVCETAKAVTVAIFEGSYLSRSVQGRVEDLVAAAIKAATAEEREACAQVANFMADNCFVEGMSEEVVMTVSGTAYDVAQAIRKRGEG